MCDRRTIGNIVGGGVAGGGGGEVGNIIGLRGAGVGDTCVG